LFIRRPNTSSVSFSAYRCFRNVRNARSRIFVRIRAGTAVTTMPDSLRSDSYPFAFELAALPYHAVAETVMFCDFEITISGHPDAELLLSEAYRNGSLTELIICAHTLLAYVITPQIENKSGKPCRGKFSKKLKIYVGLTKLPAELEQRLSAFTQLRNDVDHKLGKYVGDKYEDERTWVWDGGSSRGWSDWDSRPRSTGLETYGPDHRALLSRNHRT
jgi:hypothetical protein